MKRLGIKSKWITPSNSTCKANEGKLYKGILQATWEDAQKICRASGGELPSREDFHKVIKACGGILMPIIGMSGIKQNNSRYQKCYKQKWF